MNDDIQKPVQDPAATAARAAGKLVVVVVAMFGFGFALVPLYDVICDITGLNGKTGDQYVASEPMPVNKERVITIQFLANNNAGMPWEFRTSNRTMKVHPGELNQIDFYAKNPTGQTMVSQTVPSVTPYYAASYLHKTECFCFEQQQLASGEDIDMPMRFIIDSEIPEDITSLTLSYTMFDVTDQQKGQQASD